MINWITLELALAVHDRQIAEHGGSSGVRDMAMLESALARPVQAYAYGDPPPDLAQLAASLALGLAKKHPFIDGNKRTALVCYRLLIALNGGELVATAADKYATMIGLADGSLTESDFANWLRPRIKVDSENTVQEPVPAYG